MHGVEGRCQVYGCVCERCVACMGLKEDLKYMAVCVRMCGMHGVEGRCQVYGCV